MAVIADPTGAMLCMWQAKNNIGASLVNEHGTLSWEELMTADVPAAAAFYDKIFGWEGQRHADGRTPSSSSATAASAAR